MAQLRPFVASQRLYDHLLASAAPTAEAYMPFCALCSDVLGARLAHLIPLGPLAPLAGPPLSYPQRPAAQLPPLQNLAGRLASAQTASVPLDPQKYGGLRWAVPLWSERGLIGVLLLAEKRGGGFYTQEEVEIARASGERLVDARAGAEMARRLLAHDEVLPQVHAALLALGDDADAAPAASLLSDVHRRLSDLLRDTPPAVTPEVARLGVLEALRRAVDEELGHAFDAVTWDVTAEAEAHVPSLSPLTAEVLFYAAREAVRNAARHGRGEDEDQALALRVAARYDGAGLLLQVEDNGVGLDSSDNGGSGLALHSTMLAVVGGALTLESAPDLYTRVSLTLPRDLQAKI
jgi:signal transduction histidine kinase